MLDPFTLTGERKLISTPTYDWEKIGSTPEDEEFHPYVNEGPFCINYNGDVYLAYSASGSWGDGYCIAFMKLIGNDPLDINSWHKYDELTLCSNELVKGSGHCCIINDENEYKVFFHAWSKDEEHVIQSTVELWEGILVIEEGKIKIV
jgi:GH43 family beta-xylosidase